MLNELFLGSCKPSTSIWTVIQRPKVTRAELSVQKFLTKILGAHALDIQLEIANQAMKDVEGEMD